jgi:hypothetical protein
MTMISHLGNKFEKKMRGELRGNRRITSSQWFQHHKMYCRAIVALPISTNWIYRCSPKSNDIYIFPGMTDVIRQHYATVKVQVMKIT